MLYIFLKKAFSFKPIGAFLAAPRTSLRARGTPSATRWGAPSTSWRGRFSAAARQSEKQSWDFFVCMCPPWCSAFSEHHIPHGPYLGAPNFWWGGTGIRTPDPGPRTSCMRVRSRSHYATAASPKVGIFSVKLFVNSLFQVRRRRPPRSRRAPRRLRVDRRGERGHRVGRRRRRTGDLYTPIEYFGNKNYVHSTPTFRL